MNKINTDENKNTKFKQIDSNCISLKNSLMMLSDFVIKEFDDLKKDFYDFERMNHQRDDQVFIDLKNLFIKTNNLNESKYKELNERVINLEQKQIQTNDIIYNIEKKNSFEIEKIKKDCSDMFDKLIEVLNNNKTQLDTILSSNLNLNNFIKDFSNCENLMKNNLKNMLVSNNMINEKFDVETNEIKNLVNEMKNQTFVFKENIQIEISNLLKCQKEINKRVLNSETNTIEQQQIDLGFLKKKVNEFEKTVKSNINEPNPIINDEIDNLKNNINEIKRKDKNKANFENEVRKMIVEIESNLNNKIYEINNNVKILENKINL